MSYHRCGVCVPLNALDEAPRPQCWYSQFKDPAALIAMKAWLLIAIMVSCCYLSRVRCWCWCWLCLNAPALRLNPPPPSTLSSQQLQQQWANRCLRECPLRCPSCQNHPRPWRPQRQLFPGRLRSPHHHPVPFPPHLLPFTREMYITCIALWNKEQQAKKKRHIDQKVGTFIKKRSKCHTSPKHLKITAKRSSRGKWWKH